MMMCCDSQDSFALAFERLRVVRVLEGRQGTG